MRQADNYLRELLMCLRNGELPVDDWKVLMKRTPAMVNDTGNFENALRLFPTAGG